MVIQNKIVVKCFMIYNLYIIVDNKFYYIKNRLGHLDLCYYFTNYTHYNIMMSIHKAKKEWELFYLIRFEPQLNNK